MENEIIVFENVDLGFQVRSIEIDGNPWFVGKDVAEILGYSDTSQTIRVNVEEEDKLMSTLYVSGQNRSMVIINESGLYSLILSSKKEEAKKFKKWVTSEVLPQIRKTGKYQAPMKKSEMYLELAKIEAEKEKLEDYSILFCYSLHDAIMSIEETYTVTDLANLLEIAPRKCSQWLRDNNYAYHDKNKQLKPKSPYGYGEKNYLTTKLRLPNGEIINTAQMRITAYGIAFFCKKYLQYSTD